MKLKNIKILVLAGLVSACAFNDPELEIQDTNFPLRMEIDEEGADLADAEDFKIGIAFADYIGDLPTNEITLTYTLEGEGDFTGVAIDEVVYEYENDDDCVWEREIAFTSSTITIPVDADMGTVPEEFEIVVAFNIGEDAPDGGFELQITGIQSSDNVLFSDANTFEYEILENDAAGKWLIELDESTFENFKSVFGILSEDLAETAFADTEGEIAIEFEFEEMKFEIELTEQEEVSECEEGEVETSMENLVIEIEADYDAEDGELVFEGSYFDEDGEELDFVLEAEYVINEDGDMEIEFTSIIGEDNYEDGDELYTGSQSFLLKKD